MRYAAWYEGEGRMPSADVAYARPYAHDLSGGFVTTTLPS